MILVVGEVGIEAAGRPSVRCFGVMEAGRTVAPFWSVPHAQVYAQCDRLLAAGLLTQVRQESGRGRLAEHRSITALTAGVAIGCGLAAFGRHARGQPAAHVRPRGTPALPAGPAAHTPGGHCDAVTVPWRRSPAHLRGARFPALPAPGPARSRARGTAVLGRPGSTEMPAARRVALGSPDPRHEGPTPIRSSPPRKRNASHDPTDRPRRIGYGVHALPEL
ncbi:hypothetical protein ACWDA8_27115 [Streptomyces sp. NPDC001130]